MTFSIKNIKNFSLIVIITSIILFTVVVILANTYTPRINEYKDEFKSWINQDNDYELDFNKVGARWRINGPELIFYNPEIKDKVTQEQIFGAGEVTAEIGILDFLFGRSLVIDQLIFNRINLDLKYENESGFVLQGLNLDLFASFFNNSSSAISSFTLIGEEVKLNFNLIDKEKVIELSIPSVTMEINAEELKIDTTFNLPENLGQSILLSASKRDNGDQLSSEWQLYLEGRSLNIVAWEILQSYQSENLQDGLMDIDAWIELNSKNIERVTADIVVSDLLINDLKSEPLFLESRVEYSANEFGWFTSLDKFKFYTKEANWPESRIQIQARNNNESNAITLDVSASIIVLENLKFFDRWIEPDVINYFSEINPKGLLRNTKLNISNANKVDSMFNLSTQLDGISIDLISSNSQIDGIDGYLDINQEGGRLEIDTSNLGLNFRDYLNNKLILDYAKGEVIWRKNEAGFKISSDQFELGNTDFESNTSIEMSFLEDSKFPYIDIDSSWSVEDVLMIKRLLPENKLNPVLYQWIQESIKSGKINNGTTRVLGSLEDFPFTSRNGIFQINAQVKNMLLHYAKDWPETEILDMRLSFDRNQIYSYQNHLFSNDLELMNASIELNDIFNPKLKINAHSRAKLSAIHDFMINSPIDNFFGKNLKNLELDGEADYEFGIHLPLRSLQRKNYDFITRIKPNNARIDLTWIEPGIEDLNGTIEVTRNTASSNNLTGSFMGTPVLINLSKVTGDNESLSSIVTMKGKTSIDVIESNFGYMLNQYITGEELNYDLSLNIPRYDMLDVKPFSLNIKSDLKVLAINLPYPLAKKVDDIGTLDMSLIFPSNELIQIEGYLSSSVHWNMYFKKDINDWNFDRGTIFLNDEMTDSPDSRGLHIRGNTNQIKFDDWVKFTKVNADKSLDANYIRSIDLTMGNIDIYGRSFENQRVVANRGSDGWIIDLYGEQAEGLINLPYNFKDQTPIEINMGVLNIGKSNGTWNGNLLSPTELPSILIRVEDFAFSDHFFGAFNADFIKFEDGLRAVEIKTKADSFSINANAGWVLDDSYESGQHTYFEGKLSSSNVMDTLQRLNYQPIIDSNEMDIELDIKWPGPPRDDYLSYTNGDFSVSLGSGQLVEVEPGAGRMFGLLSVVALPRRLSLDFRDVFNKGFGFDEITGDFILKNAEAITCNLNLKGPAADIGVIGGVDLMAMQYDQAAIVSTNYGNTLPIVGAVVAGPPAAAALLLFSQIFKKPLQEMAQIYYDVPGTFEIPNINTTNAQNFALMSAKYECTS